MMGEGLEGITADDESKNLKKNIKAICEGINNGNLLNLDSFPTNLTHLKLSNCGLSHIDFNFENSESILEIDLSKNALYDLPESLISLKKVRVVNLSDNNFTKVPDVLYKGLHLIRSLDLSKNKLITFHKPPVCLPTLHHLDLSANRLVSPPPWLLDELPSSLTSLNLSINPCFQLSPVVADLPSSSLIIKVADKIKTLNLRSCGIRGGINEKYLTHFRSIDVLDLSNTFGKKDIHNFLPDLNHCPENVSELSLSDVGLACLPKTVSNLNNLRVLDVSKNIIQWFPPAVSNLKKLVILRAERSRIFLLPPEMNQLTNLKELYLADNEMNSSDGFEDLPALEVLDLYGNQFITVPNFNNLSRLRALDFSYNYIEPPKMITLGKRLCSYDSLKECLRSHYIPQKSGRIDGAKDFPVHTQTEDNYTDSDGRFSPLEYESGGSLEYVKTVAASLLATFFIWVSVLLSLVTSPVLIFNSGDYDGDSYSGESACCEKEKEVWDLDSDENYDPNEACHEDRFLPSRKSSTESLTGELPYEIKLHPHYFAPHRTISPVTLNNDLPPPSEGQFEDSF